MERKQLQGFGITLRTPEQHGNELVSITPRTDPFPEILRMRIEKVPGGQVEGPLRDPYSPIIKFFFAGKELRIEQEGALQQYLPLCPYTNAVKAHPNTLLTIPVKLLKARVYELSFRADSRGDFITLSGKFRHGSHIIVINVWALTLFDELSEIKMTGELFFRFVSIGMVTKPDNFLPFYWMQTVNLGRENRVVEEFIDASQGVCLDLISRVTPPTLTVFRQIAWEIERNGKSEKDAKKDAESVFVQLFSP